jgi:hypothetical protein
MVTKKETIVPAWGREHGDLSDCPSSGCHSWKSLCALCNSFYFCVTLCPKARDGMEQVSVYWRAGLFYIGAFMFNPAVNAQ